MLTQHILAKRLIIPAALDDGEDLQFELQPILSLATGAAMGYELLYRGLHPEDWRDIDATLLRYLTRVHLDLPLLFVNISNEGLLREKVVHFEAASLKNRVVFELSESINGVRLNKAITRRVNEMMSAGVRFALDDFGAGRDGLERLYSMSQTTAVKVDSGFLRLCMAKPDAAKTLAFLLNQWRGNGIMSIAEGVETPQIFDFAKAVGADMVQGFHVDTLVGSAVLHPELAGCA